ncbi:MAG TPA: FtsX-like permease family protein [Methanoregula sp.]|nr:FtsX-like permease family protein [Methanoregula sp.]
MKDIFFELSVRSVRLNFLRSLLASIGIVIGVVAISSMGMLGTNMQLSVQAQLSSNVNTIIVTSDTVRTTSVAGVPSTQTGIDKSTLNDITSAAGINTVIPLHHGNTQFTIGSTDGRGAIWGIAPTDITKFLTVARGDNIRGVDDCLVGSTIASQFNLNVGTPIKLGTPGTAGRPTVRVSGILASRGFPSDGVFTDNAIVLDDLFYTNHYGNLNVYDQVNVVLSDVSTLNDTEDSINQRVNRNADIVRITDAGSRIASITQTLSTITTFILAIGGISLVVAAVSIFNVMMMSVNERVQEIGILLSIGTEKGEVRRMFLYEAFILGIIGALAGGIMSLIIGYTVVNAMIGSTQYFFLPESIVYVPYGMVIGVVVCIASGVYPAWKASNMDPIDALRAE